MHNRKLITKASKLIITAMLLFIFASAWLFFYNDIAFRSHRDIGYVLTLVAWGIFYLWICNVFKAFSIASSSLGDIVISQIICIGITDFVSFIAVCFLSRGWVDILPGLECYGCQLIAMALIIKMTKNVLINMIKPSNTAAIYGHDYSLENAEFFVARIQEKYSHLFNVDTIIASDSPNVNTTIDDNDRVIFLGVSFDERKEYAKRCIDQGKNFYFIPEIEEIIFQTCTVKNLLDTPLKRYDFIDNYNLYSIIKRVTDLIFAIILFFVAIPFVLIAAVAIKIEDGGPVFFRQLRVTKGEKTFNIIKLRSMVVDADKHGVNPTVDNDPRITKVGAFCRKTRIDEVPQVINIIKGDMSFVGPRPERIEHVQKYEAELPEFKYRHMVKGGLTGYAQVYGKYNTSPEDKLRLDLMYIMNRSLYLDLRLFLLTFRTIFQKESTEGFTQKDANDIKENS